MWLPAPEQVPQARARRSKGDGAARCRKEEVRINKRLK